MISAACSQFQKEVSALAAVLQGQGLAKGDGVSLYMPVVPEELFFVKELATGIDDTRPVVAELQPVSERRGLLAIFATDFALNLGNPKAAVLKSCDCDDTVRV